MKNFTISSISALALWFFVGYGCVVFLPQDKHGLIIMAAPLAVIGVMSLAYKRLVRIDGHR